MIAEFVQTFMVQWPLFLNKCLEQLSLSGLSTLMAIFVGVPLGIFITKRPRSKRLVMGTVNIFQTIPSIAMLGFLIPIFGIGIKPALITLALYSILPIVRNTTIGIEGVSSKLIEAADGIGFTPMQKLRMVELPLALPVIIGGIRTAAVMSVGMATIAAFIGAGGLGDFIYQGIYTNHTSLVLLGAIPAALLALLMDYFFGKLETYFATGKHVKKNKPKWKRMVFSTVAVLIITLTFLYPLGKTLWASNRKNTVVIGSKSFSEQYILGEMIAQLLDAKTDLKVIKNFNLSSTDVCHQAIVNGDIDIYPEYTGTAFLTILHASPGTYTPEELFDYVNKEYKKRFQIQWLAPLGFNNTEIVAVKESFAKQNKLNNISDLEAIQNALVMGTAHEFFIREDGYQGFKKTYQLDIKNVKQLTPTLNYKALEADHVNVMTAFSTDGQLKAHQLKVLEDDKGLFPSYYAAALIRQSTLKHHPEIEESLKPLFGRINDQTMKQLNYQVDIEKRSPTEVATSFLRDAHLL